MSVPAHTNAVGGFTKYHQVKWKQQDRSWSFWDNNWRYGNQFELADWEAQNVSEKSPIVRTRVKHIDGRPVRDATTYSRVVSDMQFQDGEKPFKEFPLSSTYYSGNSCDRAWEYLNPSALSQHLGILDTDEHRRAIVECLLRLNEGKVNYGQALGESVASANMLADAGREFLTKLRDIRRGGLKGLKNLVELDQVGNNYLRWQYGWKPLASDLKGMYDHLQEGLKLPPFLTARRTIKSQRSGNEAFTGYEPANWSVKSRDSVMLMAKLTGPGLAQAQNMGLVNPLSLAWELVPYSFVVDWFMPIGNTLEALTATAGLSFVAGYHSQTREFDCEAKSTGVGSVKKRTHAFHRQAYGSFPSGALLYVKDRPFNTSNVQSMLALWGQVTGRSKVLS